eukprot:403351821
MQLSNYKTFKYCRNTSEGYFIDSTSNQNIELGTIDYPFRMLDDAIREVFNNEYSSKEVMPLLLLNHNYSIMNYKPLITKKLQSNLTGIPEYIDEISIVTNIHNENLRSNINIFGILIQKYQRPLPQSELLTVMINGQNYTLSDALVFNPTMQISFEIINSIHAQPVYQTDPYQIDRRIMEGHISEYDSQAKRYKFFLYFATLSIQGFNFLEKSSDYEQGDSLFYSVQNIKWLNISNCDFILEQGLVHNQIGLNVKLENSKIDIAKIYVILYLEGIVYICELATYYENGVQKSFTYLVYNNTFYGNSDVQTQQYQPFLIYNYFERVELIGNRFIGGEHSPPIVYFIVSFRSTCTDFELLDKHMLINDNIFDTMNYTGESYSFAYFEFLYLLQQNAYVTIQNNTIINMLQNIQKFYFMDIYDSEMERFRFKISECLVDRLPNGNIKCIFYQEYDKYRDE